MTPVANLTSCDDNVKTMHCPVGLDHCVSFRAVTEMESISKGQKFILGIVKVNGLPESLTLLCNIGIS